MNDCLRCRGTMEPGFLMDRDYSMPGVAQWVEGQPEHSIWYGVKTKGHDVHPVTSMRCTRCGMLELYARPEES